MLCENCTKGFQLDGTPAGTILPDGSYFAAAPSASPSKAAIVILTDIFGLKLVNPKIFADEFAKKLDLDVYVPNFFNGNPPFDEKELVPYVTDVPGQKWSLGQKVGVFGLLATHAFKFYQCRQSVTAPRIKNFVKKIKEEKGYTKFGAVGYCYGGASCVALATAGLISSVVIAHPAPFSIGEVDKIKIPASWICAEEDNTFPPKNRKAAEESFAKRTTKVEYEFKDYKGTVHGFAARPALQIPEVKAAFEESFAQTLNWFDKTLKVEPVEAPAATATPEAQEAGPEQA